MSENPEWIEIQVNTFTNWLNHELRHTSITINDLSTELSTGITLIRIVECLQQRICKAKVYVNNPTEIQCLMNIQIALDALNENGIKLVNIGSQDIYEGNLKLILGLIWALIQRYQLGTDAKPLSKKLVLSWLQAVLPEVHLSNFRSNWNNGIALSALINYCDDKLLSDWRDIDPENRLQNCQKALKIAEEHLNVPTIISAEYLSSSDLDELSCMTYLSYFVRKDGPGYNATLRDVQGVLYDLEIPDFGVCFNDGYLLCRMVNVCGGKIDLEEMTFDDKSHWSWNVRQALDAAINVGIRTTLQSDDITSSNPDHLAIMNICAMLIQKQQYEEPSTSAGTSAECYNGQQLKMDLAFAEKASVDIDDLDVVVEDDDGNIVSNDVLNLVKRETDGGASLTLVPEVAGCYQVHIFCEAVELPTSPIFLTVRSSSPASDQKGRPPSPMADYDQPHVGNVSFSGLNEPCSVGSHVEVVINAQGGSAQRSEVSVLSVAPSGKRRECKVTHQANSFTAIFQPDEVGQWQIGIVYAGEHIQGSPFDVQVFDADRVNVYGLDVGLVGQELKFTVDAQQAGEGAVKVSIFKNNKQIPCGVVEEGTRHRYRVHFTPDGPARYEIHITFNGMEIKGSPFILDIADASQVSVHGDFLKTAAVDKMAHFFVNAIGATAKDLNVVITGPSGKQKHAKVAAIENKAFRVEWKPVEVGEHKIDVQLYDQSIYDQHLLCNVGDPELVTVRNIPQYIDLNKIGQDLSFEIDAAAAGSGNLEIIINGGRVTCRVRELATRHFLAEFTPLQPAPHVIEMKFNGEHVRGSPWTLPIRNGQGSVEYSSGSGIRQLRSQHVEDEPYSELVGVGLHRAQVNSVSAFEVNASTGVLKASDVRVRLTDAHGAKLDVRIFEQRNGVRCEYTVKKVGDYLLEIFINNRLIDSGPLTVTGYDLNKIKVQPVKDGAPGEPVQFVVDAAEAGKGQLEISVNQGKVPNNVQMQDAGRCLVTFIPQHAGTYVIDVTFNGQQVHGCPIQVDVNSKHVGKPLSHAVHHKSGGVAVAGASSPAPSTIERGPSSAYFSGGSPQIDTSFQSPVSPLFQSQHSPRSPILVQRSSEGQYATGDQGLKSPRLVDLARADQAGRMGYTVAQYGEGQEGNSESYRTSRYFGDSTDRAEFKPTGRSDYSSPSRTDYGSPSRTEYTSPRRDYTSPSRTDYGTRTEYSTKHTEFTSKDRTEALRSPPHGDSTVDSGLGSTVTKHRYFESSDSRPHSTVEPEWRKSLIEQPPPVPKSPPPEESAQFQMTRSAEMKLYDDKLKTEDLTYKKGVGEEGYDYKVTSEKYKPGARSHVSEGHRQFSEGQQASPAPLGDVAPVSKYEPEVQRPSSRYESTVKYEVPPKDEFSATRHEARGEFSSAARQESAASRQEELPYKPESHRQYDEPPKDYDEPLKTEKSEAQPLQKATEIHGVPFEAAVERRPTTEYTPGHRRQPSGAQSTPATPGSQRRIEESGGESRSSSKPNTPRLSLKFGRDKSKDPNKGFEFGKSKFTSKHEIVRRGKDVDVKLENLKLSKEDQLRIVVLPPSSSKSEDPNAAPDLPHRVKKSGKTYEISFHPSEVGTHKVLAFVNDQPHPHSPFPIRVYDSSQIIVGEIVPQSFVNDTVEFTVDAGRAGFGNLEMAIKDNDDAIIPSHVNQLESGSAKFLVTFNPTSVGTHTVNITFNKEVIKGSPFAVQIVDPADGSAGDLSKTKDKSKQKKKDVKKDKTNGLPKLKDNKPVVNKLPSLSRVRESAHITVQIPQATDVVSAVVTDSTKEKLPVEVFEEELGLRRIEFVPQRVGDHDISVNVNGHEVNGSPFTCRAYDPSKIVVGVVPDGVVNKPVHFVVDASEGGVGNLEVAVNEGKIPSMAHPLGQHKYDISFVPRENVDHHVSVRFNNEPVPGSPFLCRLLSSLQVRAAGPGLERIAVGRETEFEITVDEPDTGKPLANPALPSVSVLDVKGNRIPVTVQKDPRSSEAGRFLSSYTPKVVGNHQIEVVYDNEPIPGSPFSVKAFDASCCRLILEEQAIVGKACTFLIDAAKAGAGNMEIIVSVDNKNVPNFVQPEGQARFKVFFTPQEVKDHVISVKFNSEPIPGSPLKCPVYAEKTLSYEPNYSVPPPVPSTPPPEQELKLVGDLRSAQIGRPKGFSIDSPHPGADCNVVITDSTKSPLPVRCYKQQDQSYWVEFTPETIGEHIIEVTFADFPVNGSPFHCEVVDPKKVKVSGLDETIQQRHITRVLVDRTEAGKGQLDFEVSDPQGQELKVDRVRTAPEVDSFTFLPSKLGQHKVLINFAGFPVQGAKDFTVVEYGGAPKLEGPASQSVVEVDKTAKLWLESKNGGLKIDVRDQLGNKIRHQLAKAEHGATEISFVPANVGKYSVDVHLNNKALSEKPLEVTVVDPRKVVVNDETARADGTFVLGIGQKNIIDVDATAAGHGDLNVEVRDASGELLPAREARAESQGRGKHRLILQPSKKGALKIYLYYSGLPVPSAYPLMAVAETGGANVRRSSADQAKIYSTEAGRGYGSRGQSVEHTTHYSTSEARPHSTEQRTRSSTEYTTTHRTNVEQTKNFGASSDNIHHSLRTSADQTVRVHGEGLSRAIVKEPAEFIIDASQAPRAKITAQLIGEQNDIPVRLQEKSNNIYKAVYTPLAGGDYELIVKIDGKPLREQPFVVHVQSFTTPAGQIEVDTKNLKLGIINEDIKTVIDARKAGSGQLSAQCEGPTQLEYCELYDNRDGTYVLRVQPKELGRHVLSIKYANEHVPGSPFVFNVSNPPDASKVKVYGPGVEHGILATFKSNFVVETKGAGAGQLTVRVRGPKGAFNVEMQRDRQQDRTIHCKYEPKEPGDYQVEVKWHGQHVPGSPFMVMIVDTEQELQRFLAGEAPSPQPATPFVPPGWVGPPPPGMIPPPFSPALAASPYGPVPVGMIPPPHMRGRRSGPPAVMGPPQPIYGRRPY